MKLCVTVLSLLVLVAAFCSLALSAPKASKSALTPVSPGSRSTCMTWN
uniref:Isoform 7 of C-C motif chemokine 4-like n=1 Tax=Homo sapiens TaxID=9606 RepID=Q8NHW4-7|nr:CC chemokine ligand 4L2d2 [Homo sapiens]AAX07315.1 CC chemokine ligand 4L2d2 [Homo sapiens]